MSVMLAEAPAAQITMPGIYNIPEDLYHRDPVPGGSLSCSGAKKLLAPSCPAKFDYERRHPKPPSRAMELGTAAHHLVLGVGQPLAVLNYADYRTTASPQAAKEAREAGEVPLLPHEYLTVWEMADALRRDPLAAALLDPERGDPERSIFWTDQETGIWRRCRFDHLPHKASGKVYACDYKTIKSADPESVRKDIYNYGYYIQDPFYCDGLAAMNPGADIEFYFVFQEKDAPYLVNVARIDEPGRRLGRERVREAVATFKRCQETGEWPGYTTDINVVSLPAWAPGRTYGGLVA